MSTLRTAHFFLTSPAPTEIYTLSLHDALPIYRLARYRAAGLDLPIISPRPAGPDPRASVLDTIRALAPTGDRKSTRLNSSHANISYAVFCLKKKKRSTSHHPRFDKDIGACTRE